MKKFKNFYYLIIALCCMVFSLTSCGFSAPDADEEGVLIKKPWFFGHGGVDEEPVSSGLTWIAWSTETEYIKITPQRHDVGFDDIMSNDNTPLDYATYITLQVESGKSPILIKNYGKDWFKHNIEAIYRNYVREEVSKYSPFDLMSNREICNKIDSTIQAKITTHITKLSSKKEFPITCREVITGRAKPNDLQLKEMNNTAAAIQAKVTQERKAEMEEARANAERKKAIADKAYMNEMNMSPNDFLMLKIIEKSNPNIDVIFGGGGTSSMFNIRR